MTMTNLPAAVLSFGLEDASGSHSQMQFHVPFATLASVALIGAGVIRPLIEAATDCAIVSQSLTYAYRDPLHATPVAGSRVEEKGVVIMRAANGRPSRVAIPGIKDDLLNTSGSIDRTNADFIALFAAILDASAVFCSADGSDLVSVDKAYQAFRRSTKGSLPTDR
jgi:hypothetical protein